MRRALFSSASVAIALTVLLQCRAATQIVVDVTTNASCASGATTEIAVGPLAQLESRPSAATKTGCDPTGHVGRLVVIPSGNDDDGIAFRVVMGVDGRAPESCGVGGDWTKCIVARRALRFLPHVELDVDVALRTDCENIPCSAITTCVHGQCVDATIQDPSACERPGGCDETALSPGDGGAPDGSFDATNDRSNDGADSSTVACGGGCPLLVSSGEGFACRVTSGQALCWGASSLGQLGRDTGGAPDPNEMAATSLTNVVAISSGRNASCVRRGDSSIACWGELSGIDTAFGGGRTAITPTIIPAMNGATLLGVDTEAICWSNGPSTLCAGDNGYGSLGVGDRNTHGAPVAPQLPAANVIALAAGNYTLCAVIAGGDVYCWGGSTYGEADPAHPDGMSVVTPTRVDLSSFGHGVDVSVGEVHACVALDDSGVVCWGSNAMGQSGRSPVDNVPVPQARITTNGSTSLVGVKSISVGWQHSCALLATGHVACWGDNSVGQLGRGIVVDAGVAGYPFAAEVTGLDGVSALASGRLHTCALRNGTEIWCWGSNESGEMGLPVTTTAVNAPRRVR